MPKLINQKPSMAEKKRPLAEEKSKKGTSNGKLRHDLYAKLLQRIDSSIEQGFYLEAVTLEESFIADRLESYAYYKKLCGIKKNLGDLLRPLSTDPEFSKDLHSEIDSWRKNRNAVLHEMAKFDVGEEADWDAKYSKAKNVAEHGKKLLRKTDKEILRLRMKTSSLNSKESK